MLVNSTRYVSSDTGVKSTIGTQKNIYEVERIHTQSLPDACHYSANQTSYTVQIPLITTRMLWTAAIIVFILWLLGFNFHVGGNLVHTLLVIVLILVIVELIS